MSLPPQTPRPPGNDGFAFAPADDSLIAFLRRKLAGEPLPAPAGAHLHDADIYAADPATLTAGYQPSPAKKGEGGSSWLFFTHVRPKSGSDSRKSRQVGGGAGTWHSERAPRRVLDGEGNCVGHGQYFSYKRRAGKCCSERTDWYMVEYTEDQEADLNRVRGGEPQLVLCKIYKAHAHSRSGNGSASSQSSSASARKRKVSDDRVDLASAPVNARRRLFGSPAPVSAATAQEQLCSPEFWFNFLLSVTGWECKQETSHEKLSSEPETSHEKLSCETETSHGKLSSEPETSHGKLSTEPETSHGKLCSEGWINCQDKSNAASDSEPSHDKVTPSESVHSFWMPETGSSRVDTESFLMAGDASSSAVWISDPSFRTEPEESNRSLLMTETEASQVDTTTFLMAGDAPPGPAHALCSASWISDSAFRTQTEESIQSLMTETEASQIDTTSFLMAGDAAPTAPSHCAPGSSSSASWMGNNITSSCSSELGWFPGVPTDNDEMSLVVARFTGASSMCSMPSSSSQVPQATASSWWCSGVPDIWSC